MDPMGGVCVVHLHKDIFPHVTNFDPSFFSMDPDSSSSDLACSEYKELMDVTDVALERAVACIYAERDHVRTHAWAFSDPEICLDHLEYKLASVREAMYHAKRCESAMHGTR